MIGYFSKEGVYLMQYLPHNAERYSSQAMEYMKKNIEVVKIADVANYLNLDRSYFSSIFKLDTGISPSMYLVTLRMDTARRLLTETDQKISDIAVKVGYENPLTFSKMFRIKVGICPREYRNLHRISPNL